MKTEDRLKEREVTVEYLEKAFDHYNHLCFGGLLPRPRLRLSRAKSRLGWMRYKVDANGESPIPYDFTIGITTAYRLNTEQIDDVLIHEMIHYHIAYHQLRDNAPHGRRFRQIMETINHDYQRHIRISVDTPTCPRETGTIPGLPTTAQLRAAPIGCHPTSYWLSRPRTATTSSRQ